MPASTRSSTDADAHTWVLVLAGGIGSRFWPLSTPERPKQLLPLASDRPLVVETVERALALVPPERLRILAGAHLVEAFRRVLPRLPAASYLIEPAARGTAPVLAWAAREVGALDPDAVLVSLHADHFIAPLDAFRETVNAAVSLAREHEVLLTVGVRPDRVETGFGHIEPGEPLASDGTGARAWRVRTFHEKPDARTARRYMDAGFLWNTGIFVWRASVFLDELHRHAPEVAERLPRLADGPESFFRDVPACVVDRAVLERSEKVAVVAARFSWDDVGNWDALARIRGADAQGNVTDGDTAVVEGRGNVAYAEGGRVVLFGVEDLVVVRTPDVTLVLPRARASELKSLLARIDEGQP